MMRSHTQEAGAGQQVIDGYPCAACGQPFHLANYDNRVIANDRAYHPECVETTPEEDECRGFQWIGQSFEHCDRCGRDITLHEGMESSVKGSSIFSGDTEIVSFAEYEERSPLFSHHVTANDGSGQKRYNPPESTS